MNAVEVKNLKFAYKDGTTVLNDISISISMGEVFVFAGLSGSGKTTLCHILSGIIPNAIPGTLDGQVTIMDIDPAKVGLPQTALRAGMVFQDSDSQIICTTVEDELAFGLENLCKPPEEIRLRVDELLTEFGMQDSRQLSPSRLSGGQKKLLAIAAVLAPSPPILILDEPFTGLDSEGRTLVQAAIDQQRSKGRTVIMVEHDLRHVMFADRWLILKNGTIVACEAPPDLLKRSYILKDAGVWE